MSKAEKRALEKYPAYKSVFDKYEKQRYAYICGYIQAEQDLGLTWEDIRELYIIFAEVDVEIELCKTDIQAETIGYYQEVLRRFKLQKGK